MNDINKKYFNWLVNKVCSKGYSYRRKYKKLLRCMFDYRFYYINEKDENREGDAVDLKFRFADEYCDEGNTLSITQIEDGLSPNFCSIFEVLVAVAIRCESIMGGDDIAHWFWEMILSLGLNGMTDDSFDEKTVTDILEVFLKREYKPNGEGGLFTIRDCAYDLRNVEIWYQMCWYLNSICEKE